MKNKRTKKSAIMACGLAALIGLSGAFAFMSDHDNAINKFSFTDNDGNQTIDVQLSETEWVEEDGKDIQYGTPVAKNPVATNLGSNDMYAFATVIVPAKQVAVQNVAGALVDTDGVPADLADLGFKYIIASNVSDADKVQEDDETEILGVFTSSDLAAASELAFGDEIDTTAPIYFKLNASSPYGVAYKEDGTAFDADNDDPSDIAYKVLADTVDADNYTSDILGHQFMLKLVEDDDPNAVTPDYRELYHFLGVDANDASGFDRSTSKTPVIDPSNVPDPNNAAWTAYDVDATIATDTDAAIDVYARNFINNGWVEITESISNPTIYIDSSDPDNIKVYSAHVFFWNGTAGSAVLAPEASTAALFNAVELINVAADQLDGNEDMNIYVETYGVQVSGTRDALSDTEDGAAQGAADGVILWNVLTNSENQESFDIFGVVKDTQDA